MIPRRSLPLLFLLVLANGSVAESDSAPVEVIISIPDQKLAVVREGGLLKKYKVSTSRFGLGDSYGSYKTPLGRLRVWEKLGGDLPSGAVLKHRSATGEILPANAPGRDPIVSRILWLEGLEPQNDHARGRGIYIHGTTEESHIGKPVSWGCIRMRSEDVIELYEMVSIGAMVTIIGEDLPRIAKWRPTPPVLLESESEVKLVSNSSVRPARSGPERLPPVAESLRPSKEQVTPPDAGAAKVLRESILFAGLPPISKPAAKTPPKSVSELPARGDLFAVNVSPASTEAIALRVQTAVPPMGLIDLRRVSESPLLAFTSILDAPSPVPASQNEADLDTSKSAVVVPLRASLH